MGLTVLPLHNLTVTAMSRRQRELPWFLCFVLIGEQFKVPILRQGELIEGFLWNVATQLFGDRFSQNSRTVKERLVLVWLAAPLHIRFEVMQISLDSGC